MFLVSFRETQEMKAFTARERVGVSLSPLVYFWSIGLHGGDVMALCLFFKPIKEANSAANKERTGEK